MGIRKGDQVVVITGKNKGKKGKVVAVTEAKVTVEGVNIVVKNKKARQGAKAAREKMAAPIDISNVMVMCKCGKATRIAHKIDEKGNKSRVCAKCGAVLDRKFVKIKEKAKEVAKEEVKEDEKVDKTQAKPLARRESKFGADSKIKGSIATGHVNATHRQIGGQ